MLDKKLVYLPRNILLGFLLFSEILLVIGPFRFDINNYMVLYVYLAVVNLAFYLGYNSGTRTFRPSYYSFGTLTVALLLIFGFLLTLRRMLSMWAHRGLTLSLTSLVYALTNSGEVYQTTVEVEQMTSSLIWVLLEPIRWAAIPVGLANWKKIGKGLRWIVIFTIMVEILAWLGIGTRKGLFDVIVITFFTMIAAFPSWITVQDRRKKLITVSAIAAGLFLFYFVVSGASRRGYEFNEIDSIVVAQEIKPSFQNAPDWLLYSMCSTESYLCQGYYALSKGLEMGIRPITVGGSGWFTIMLMRKMGYDPEPDTYMAALEQYGIDRSINWHTIYLWLANDVTFIGVPFLIFLIGLLLSLSWQDAAYGKNQVAFPFFALMLIMVFYFYANNQVLSFSFMPFVFWLLFYLITRSIVFIKRT